MTLGEVEGDRSQYGCKSVTDSSDLNLIRSVKEGGEYDKKGGHVHNYLLSNLLTL
jgi:hypothetical protein